MKYYDARIIEGCCVFSYTVEPPVHAEKASAEKRKNKSSFLKKMLLPFFFLLLAPFALAFDMVCVGVKKLASAFRFIVRECSQARELAACILVAISSTAIIPLVWIFL